MRRGKKSTSSSSTAKVNERGSSQSAVTVQLAPCTAFRPLLSRRGQGAQESDSTHLRRPASSHDLFDETSCHLAPVAVLMRVSLAISLGLSQEENIETKKGGVGPRTPEIGLSLSRSVRIEPERDFNRITLERQGGIEPGSPVPRGIIKPASGPFAAGHFVLLPFTCMFVYSCLCYRIIER